MIKSNYRKKYPVLFNEARHEERTRIMRELHDELGALTFSVNVETELIRYCINSGDIEAALKKLDAFQDNYVRSISSIKNVVKDGIVSHVPENASFKSALEKYICSLASRSGVRIITDIQDLRESVSKEYKINIFRIVQEALSNILRHSCAHEASVKVSANGSDVNVYVADDGIGFKIFGEKADISSGSLGIRCMRQRAEAYGGVLFIRAEPFKGTVINVSIPMEQT